MNTRLSPDARLFLLLILWLLLRSFCAACGFDRVLADLGGPWTS